MKKSRIAPLQSQSLRQLAGVSVDAMTLQLQEYYPECLRAFPMEGEIETLDTFLEVLQEPGTWDIIVLKDEMQKTIGGIHYQVLSVEDAIVDRVGWAEHGWVAQEHRCYPNFCELMRTLESAIKTNGGKLIFLEFHNPRKMTPAQIAEAAQSGITVEGSLKLLRHEGVCVAVDANNEIAAYGQPSMDGQPAVEYFSIGFVGDNTLAGTIMPAEDYLKIMHAAHLTIDGVDLASDPTVVAYTDAVRAGGDLVIRPLAEILAA